eukprot:4319053-Prymnesium_polylepis.1
MARASNTKQRRSPPRSQLFLSSNDDGRFTPCLLQPERGTTSHMRGVRSIVCGVGRASRHTRKRVRYGAGSLVTEQG